MLRGLAFFVMLASLPSWAAVLDTHLESQSDLKKELRQCEGKLFLLKSPSSFDVIHFDQQGHPTREPTGGSLDYFRIGARQQGRYPRTPDRDRRGKGRRKSPMPGTPRLT